MTTDAAARSGPRLRLAPTAWTPTARCRAMVSLLLLSLLIPAQAVPGFDGLPIASGAEAVAVVLACILLAFPQAVLSAWKPSLEVAGWSVVIVSLLLKIGLAFVSAPGFAGCYRILIEPVTAGCEKSFDAPLAQHRTRTDDRIDFRGAKGGPARGLYSSNWRIGAANTLKYNFYEPDPRNRDRLPLAVTWHGAVGQRGQVVVRYVGEGSLRIGDRPEQLLPAVYDREGSVVAGDAAVGERVTVRYRWAPSSNLRTPYASIRLVDDAGRAVRAAGPPSVVRVLGWLLLLLLGGATVAGLLCVLRELFRASYVAVPVAAAVGGLSLAWAAAGVSAAWVAVPVVLWTCAVAGLRCGLPRRATALFAVVTAPLLAAGTVQGGYGALFTGFTYRTVGNDFLTYESQARAILTRADLQGGEDVFVYSPGMRYVLFLQHLLFGEADRLIAATGLAGMLLGLAFAAERLVASRLTDEPLRRAFAGPWRRRPPLAAVGAAVGAVSVLALLVGVPELSLGGFVLYSEYPTWIAILFAFPLVVAARGTRAAVAASLLLGLAIFLRGDQAVGVAALLAVALYRFAWRERTSRAALVRGSAAVLVPVMALALLPALHNAVYGHTVAFLAQTPRLPENFPLPPSALLHLQRSGTLDVLRSQVAGVLVLPEVDAKAHVRALLRVVAVLVQLGVVGVVVAALTRRLAVPRRVMWLLALPAAYLLVHVFVQVYVYYPRHVLVGYLTAALTLVAVAGCHLAARVASEIEPVSRRRARAASGGRSRR